MKKKIYLILIAALSFSAAYAQYGSDNLKGKFYLAPDFGLVLGSVNQIEVSPALGYHLTDRFSVAAGFKYEFYSVTRVYSYQTSGKTSIYGPKAFLKYTLINNFNDFLPIGIDASVIAHAEFEANSYEVDYFPNTATNDSKRFWNDSFLIGGGISESPSQRLRVNILFLWNTNTSAVISNSNPIIRFGIQIYLYPIESYPE